MKTDEILKALNEAVDALGDIPEENCITQQKNAYNLCIEARDELLKTQQEAEK